MPLATDPRNTAIGGTQPAPQIGPGTLRALFQSMRPKQWTKNGVIFLPLIFTANLYWKPFVLRDLVTLIALAGLAFVLFCLISSAVYLINDLADVEKDRQHPTKRNRPLASGRLHPTVAVVAAAGIVGLGMPLAFFLSTAFGLVTLVYLLSSVLYTFVFKHVVLIDVFALASGYLLRAIAGAVVIGVPISPWLYVCTTLGALFLGFTKRRQELILLNNHAGKHRAILQEYSPQLLDEILAVITSSTVMAYSLYTFTAENLPKNHAMMATIPFVLYGVFRYLYLIHQKGQGGSPEDVLLRDKPLILDILLWVVAVAAILIVYR
ncbi:MAG: decaprenyl-phosphate phosphoribosyltransferase [Chloroflexi bacterium]|nr:decaprenyl-phosphate phosphoribosyltransferase [Chloroflexota bacterium]